VKFQDYFDLEDRPECRCIIFIELISEEMYCFVDWYISAMINSTRVGYLEFEGLQATTILRNGPTSLKRIQIFLQYAQYFTEKTSQGTAKRAN
jgi:hypothetical protein